MNEDIQIILCLILCGVLFGGNPDLIDALAAWLLS